MNSRKISTSASLITIKPLTVWITTNCGKFFGIPSHFDLPPEKLILGQEETELDMEQQTGSKLGKKYVKAICCHHAYLTYM